MINRTKIVWDAEVLQKAQEYRERVLRERAKRRAQQRQKEKKEIQRRAVALPPKTRGYVYVICATMQDATYYKIGKTAGLNGRVSSIRGQFKPFPVDVERIASAFVADMHAAEQDLHKRYRSQNVMGEWFRLSDRELQEIQNILADLDQPHA